jgi:hypothetical protein
MNQIIDRVMNYPRIDIVVDNQNLGQVRATIVIILQRFRQKSDADELIEYGLAYLRGLQEAPDCRYIVC